MPNPKVNGTLDAFRTSRTWRYDPQTGFVYLENWAGAGVGGMAALSSILAGDGVAHEISLESGKYVLDSTNTNASSGGVGSGGEVTIDTWQILHNQFSIPVLKNPRHHWDANPAKRGAYSIATAYQQIITDYQNGGYSKIAEANDALLTQFDDDSDTTSYDNAIALLARIGRGEDHFFQSGYVLKHTTNVGARSTWNVSDTYVDCIYSFSELLAECQSAQYWAYPLPNRLATKILWLNDPGNPARPVDVTGYEYGWLKQGSTETTAANYRIDISTEYILGQISTEEYAQR